MTIIGIMIILTLAVRYRMQRSKMEKFWMILEIDSTFTPDEFKYFTSGDRKSLIKIKDFDTDKERIESELINLRNKPHLGNLILLESISEGKYDYRNGLDEKPFIWIEPISD